MDSFMGETLDSTVELMSEITKLTKFLTNHGTFGDFQDELVNRANVIIGEMEQFCPLFKKDCILFDEMCTKSYVENVGLQDELLVVKKERDVLMVEIARLKEDERIARERAKMVEEKLAKDFEEQSHMVNEKCDMISKLKGEVLEKDEKLKEFQERLKCMGVEVEQKNKEVNEINSTMSEITKLVKSLTSYGNFGNSQDELVKGANEVIGEMEKFCVQFKKDCISFDEMRTKFHVEKMELQDELVVVKKQRDDLMEKFTRLEEDVKKASERAEMVEEKLAVDIVEQTQIINEKSEMKSKLNAEVLWKDEMLNGFRERLKCVEMEVVQKEQEVNDLKEELARSKDEERKAREWGKMLEDALARDFEEQTQITKEKDEIISELNVKATNLNNQVLEKDDILNGLRERVKFIEVKVAQKEQEVNDLKHNDAAAYQSMEEKLKKQVLLECDQMLNAWKEKMRLLEVKVLQKEQEVHDFKQHGIASEKNLKNQVLERDQMLSKCSERLRLVEVKVLQREQELNDLNHQNAATCKVVEERLKNHILESDQLLNMCKGRLECMEAKVLQLEQELCDLKHQQLSYFQISKENLKFMEVKVVQKEQEIHDLEHQKSEAYKVMEEKLKNQVLENDKMLNEFEEKLKHMEVKVVQREQEVDDLKRQILASFQVSKEKLKFLEVKVARREQELHEFRQQKSAASKNSEEMLINQVLERDQTVNVCEQKLKLLEVQVLQKEQEVLDLNHQKVAAYQIIRKLTHKQTALNQIEEALRRQNIEAYENAEKLKQLLSATERDQSSDEELKDNKEKLIEADKNLEVLRGENLVALRAVEEFKEWMLAADRSFETNKERWEGLQRIKIVEEGLIRVLKTKVLDLANSVLNEAVDVSYPIPKGGRELLCMRTGRSEGSGNDDESAGSQSHSSPPHAEASNRADLEKGTGKSHYSDFRDLLVMSPGIKESVGNTNVSTDQAVLQIRSSSPRIDAKSTDVEKETDRSQGSAAVQVAYSEGKARPREWDYDSDIPASVKGSISELPSLKQSLSLVAFSLRKRRLIGKAFEDIVNKRRKKEQTQKPSPERCESISLNSPVPLIPVLRSCKGKAAASDSQIEITNPSVPLNPVLRSCKDKVAASDSQIIINIDSSSDEDPTDDFEMEDVDIVG